MVEKKDIEKTNYIVLKNYLINEWDIYGRVNQNIFTIVLLMISIIYLCVSFKSIYYLLFIIFGIIYLIPCIISLKGNISILNITKNKNNLHLVKGLVKILNNNLAEIKLFGNYEVFYEKNNKKYQNNGLIYAIERNGKILFCINSQLLDSMDENTENKD